MLFTLVVNGERLSREADPDDLLVDFLHDAGKTGTKYGCGIGQCGSCKVAVQEREGEQQRAVLACHARLGELEGLRVTTVEGLAQGDELHPLQRAFLKHHSFQCGYSTPGMLMAGYVLIDQLSRYGGVAESLLDQEIAQAMERHLCRCTGYVRYFEAIRDVILHWKEYTAFSGGNSLVRPDGEEPRQVSVPSCVWFRLVKKSRNDLEEKWLEGRFDAPEGELRFRRPMDWETCTGQVSVDVSRLSTGEPIRDLNLRKVLFGGIRTLRLEIERVEILGAQIRDDSLPVSTVPLRVTGNLRVADQGVSVSAEVTLTVVSSNQMVVRSRQPVRLRLASLALPVESFGQRFGLSLGEEIELGVDNALVRYRWD